MAIPEDEARSLMYYKVFQLCLQVKSDLLCTNEKVELEPTHSLSSWCAFDSLAVSITRGRYEAR